MSKTFHWVMTVQSPVEDGGYLMDTISDTIEWSGTREDAFYECHIIVAERTGRRRRDLHVLFWSFEPNSL